MQKKRIAQYCCAALVAAGIGLNIQNAIADYGIAENSFSLVAVGGSNSGSNSNSNSNSNGHGVKVSACLGLLGDCTLPDGTQSKAPAVYVTF